MAKIIILRDNQIVQEVELVRDRMTIGRKPHNDIVIPHSAASGEHAALTSSIDGVFLEDLRSTNGTYVNGERIVKCLLEDHDVIVVAKSQIEFIAGPRAAPASVPQTAAPLHAMIEVKVGPNAGKKLTLDKPVSTIGRPGVQVIAITRQGDGFYCAYVDGHRAPLLNGRPMGKTAQPLSHGDAIEIVGGSLLFSLSTSPP